MVLLCLAPLLLGAVSTADVGRLRGSEPVPPPVPPLLEKLLDFRRALTERPVPAFPAPPGYRLPWPAGLSHVVAQAPGEGPTHQSLHAWDFGLRYELVLASRGGRVSAVRAIQQTGGCDSAFTGSGNYVLINHGDGTSALYLHIDYHGALVQEGALVNQGDVIAYSGSSGLSCGGGGWAGPHLHFQVQRTAPGKWWGETIPITFGELDGDTPATGGSYLSENLPSGLFGRALMARLPRRAALGAEVYVPPWRSFLAQSSGAPAPTPVPTSAPPAKIAPVPAVTPTSMPTWWIYPAEPRPTIPVPSNPPPPPRAVTPVPGDPSPPPATPAATPTPTG